MNENENDKLIEEHRVTKLLVESADYDSLAELLDRLRQEGFECRLLVF